MIKITDTDARKVLDYLDYIQAVSDVETGSTPTRLPPRRAHFSEAPLIAKFIKHQLLAGKLSMEESTSSITTRTSILERLSELATRSNILPSHIIDFLRTNLLDARAARILDEKLRNEDGRYRCVKCEVPMDNGTLGTFDRSNLYCTTCIRQENPHMRFSVSSGTTKSATKKWLSSAFSTYLTFTQDQKKKRSSKKERAYYGDLFPTGPSESAGHANAVTSQPTTAFSPSEEGD